MAKGCAGADLLAYRSRDDDPIALVRAARGALGQGRLIVAGSIAGPAQIADLTDAGADAFTIGTAIFEGAFGNGDGGNGDIPAQLDRVMEACG
jgi:hypothetical protein